MRHRRAFEARKDLLRLVIQHPLQSLLLFITFSLPPSSTAGGNSWGW